MKYGETLRQRSIPAWSHHNIDYDDIKRFIKEETTRGPGKSIVIPGQRDGKLLAFEDSFFAVLADQHLRIDLFVRSKAGEIKRRLDHAKKQLQQLSDRATTAADRRIPVGRLERYGRLENDVLAAGDEIKSLARFTSTQRTAIRKLLKKYRKWTGSSRLEERFKDEVLDDPKGFTNLDLGPLLDDYSNTLKSVRTLYEERIQQSPARRMKLEQKSSTSSTIAALQRSIDSGSKLEFDSAMATVPLGHAGTLASYFVHPENVVELQLALLQHTAYYDTRSRSNSIHSPVATTPLGETPGFPNARPDSFALAADDITRFSAEQNALTVKEREVGPGALPQRTKYCAHWTDGDEAVIAARGVNGETRLVNTKRKHVEVFFDKDSDFPSKKNAQVDADVLGMRREFEQGERVQPLYKVSRCRTRFTGLGNNSSNVMIATLDTGLTFEQPLKAGPSGKSSFPFAVLAVRQEGPAVGALINALDHSHLAERVRGFSMEHHAAWQVCKSSQLSPPSWVTMLSEDIRKLPPPALERKKSLPGTSSGTRTQGSISNSSEPMATDSTTAVETVSTLPQSDLESVPIRSFRRKRRRSFANELAQPQQQRYWSEYDHPEDGEDNDDAYVLYIDPNEKSAFDKLIDKLSTMFGTRRGAEEEALLASPVNDDESSSDDDPLTASKSRSYGTLARQAVTFRGPSGEVDAPIHTHRMHHPVTPTQVTSICLVASLVIVFVAFLLAMTGRHKYAAEVDFGIIFAVASSLLFAILGFASLLRQQAIAWAPWLIALSVLIFDALGSSFLLAYMLG